MTFFHAGFDPSGKPVRVRFEFGGWEDLTTELDRVGGTKVLVLKNPQQGFQSEEVAAALGGATVGPFSNAAMHTPVQVTEAAMAAFAKYGGGALCRECQPTFVRTWTGSTVSVYPQSITRRRVAQRS